MFKKILIHLLVYVMAFYPMLGSLANAGSNESEGTGLPLNVSPIKTLGDKSMGGQGSETNLSETTKVKLQKDYGKLPLFFIQNNGQMDKRVKYYEKGSSHATFFANDGVYLSLQAKKPKIQASNIKGPGRLIRPAQLNKPEGFPYSPESEGANVKSEFIKLMPVGANKSPEIIAEAKMEGKVNYFIGNDSKDWKTNIPTYGAIVYKEIYKDIDMKFYGNNRQLEYDIIVKPGADPNKVRLSYEGIEGLRITDDGNLEIALKQGKLIQKRPYIYQEIDGKRVEVDGAFKVFHSTPATDHSPLYSYSFQVASYNKNYPLIIDPVIVYSTYLGGMGDDYGFGIAVDSYGNAYVVGMTSSIDFPLSSPYQGVYGGGDIFITKFNAAGTGLIYSTYLGGGYLWYGGTFPSGYIAVDRYGNAYVTGQTSSTDFPLKSPIYTTGNSFVTKINASGSQLVYSTYLGNDYSSASDIAVDTSGNAYVTGTAYEYPYYGDAFVIKINAAGTALVYSKIFGGSMLDLANDIAVDGSGNAYITGETSSYDFPVTSKALRKTITDGGNPDAFVVKINSKGTVVYSTYLGGNNTQEGGMGIAADSKGNAYVTGWTSVANYPGDFPIAPSNNPMSSGGSNCNAFVTKLNSTGSGLVYSILLGRDGDDDGIAIAVDKSGNAYVTGTTDSPDFPIVNPIDNTCGPSGENFCETHDAFISKINATGTAFVYSTYLGGDSSYERGNGIAVDSNGNAYVTGETFSTDFPLQTPYRAYSGGRIDAFVTKIQP